MSDEMFIKKYEELLDKGYCNCNEMNCIDNNTPRRILKIAKNLQQENQKLKEEIERLKKEKKIIWQSDNKEIELNLEIIKALYKLIKELGWIEEDNGE